MSTSPTIAILAGGLATRLGELVATTPKALLDVAGRPFLAWQLELLHAQGVDEVVLCLGHQGEQVMDRLPELRPSGMRVRASFDGPRQLGTGGAIAQALPLLSDPFLVMYGDSYLRCNYLAVHRHFVTSQREATELRPLGLMTVWRNADRFDTSNVVFAEGHIRRYSKSEKLPEMQHIDWGLGELSHEAFSAFAGEEPFDLSQVYEALVSRQQLVGYEVEERFYEIGSRSGLADLRAVLAQ